MAIKNLEKFDLENPIGGGPISVDRRFGTGFLTLNDIPLGEEKRDLIIYLEYFKKENRYGFSVYDKKK